MLKPRDIDLIRDLSVQALSMENEISDRLLLTFHYYTGVPSGGDIGRHYDNSPLNPWDSDTGFTTVEKTKIVSCMYIPPVLINNLVQEGYHPNSEVEVYILGRDLNQAGITIDNIRNSFEYVSMPHPHEIGLFGRTQTSINRLWDIVSVRPLSIANQIISVTLGLTLREQDNTKVGVGDKV